MKNSLVAITITSLALSASANIFPEQVVSPWFSADVSAKAADTNWSGPTSGEAAVEDDVIVLDTELNDKLTYTPAASTEQYMQLKFKTKFFKNSAAPDLTKFKGAQAAITVVGAQWAILTSGGWTLVDPAAEISEDKWYDVLIEINNKDHIVRYSVGGTQIGDGTDTEKKDGFYPMRDSTKTQVSSVAFAGVGYIDDFAGESVAEGTGVEPSDDPLAPPQKIVVPAAYIPSGKTATSKAVNDLTYWQCYALGIDLTKAADKAKLATRATQNTDAGTMTLSLGDITPNKASGMPVKYKLGTMLAPGGTITYDDDAAQESSTFEAPLPTSGVKYYTIGIQFGE